MPDIVYLAELKPALAAGGAVQTIRLSSNPAWTRADGVDWLPTLAVPFRRNLQVFDGQFQSNPEDFGSLEFAKSAHHSAAPLTDMVWDGRAVKIWKGVVGQATAAMTVVFEGEAEKIQGDRARFAVILRGPNIEVPLLPTSYAGTGLAEGGTDLKNVPKPLLLGTAMNIEPKYVNRALGIFQYHGYGAAGGVQAVFDSGSQLGTSIGDYATYAALAAATVPAGRYATCNALGMGRHGGDITGILTIDAAGAVAGGLPGAIIKWILRTHLGLAAGKVKEDSLDWLDGQIPHAQDVYVTDQTTAQEFVAGFMLSLGGYLHFLDDGHITVGLVRRGAASTITLNRQNIAVGLKVQPTSPPVWKRNQGYQRSWRTHSFSEVRTPKEINPRGAWSASPTPVYQYYDLVDYGAASYIYVASAAGNTAIPGTDSLVWQLFRQNGAPIIDSPTTPADPVPGLLWRNSTNGQLRAYIAGSWVLTSDVTAQNIAQGFAGQGALATQNTADWATQLANRPLELTDGRITSAIRAGGALQGSIWGGSASVQITEIFESLLQGKSLSQDSDFSRGAVPSNYGLYNNAGGTKVSVAIISGQNNAPNGSGNVLRVSYDGTGAGPGVDPMPGYGGFVQLTTSAGAGISRPGFYSPNSQLAFIYKAKIPVGRTIEHSSNATGDQGAWQWITPNAGTGDWATYIGIRTIGTTGTFSTTGHTYVAGGPNTAFSWDIAKYEIRELNSEALPQLARLIDGTGAIRTDSELITLLGTSAAIVGQGYMATQNFADWSSRVTGTGKPSDNASSSLVLYGPSPVQYSIQGNTVTRVSSTGWTSNIYSIQPLTGSFRVTCCLPISDNTIPGNGAMMFGVTDTPGVAGDYSVGDYCWYNNYGLNTYGIYESGNGRGAIGGAPGVVDPNVPMSIEYDGSTIKYYRGAALMYETATTPGRTFYVFIAINSQNAKISGLTFAPLTDVSKSVNTLGPLTGFGSYSDILGNTMRKRGGTHGAVQGGAYGQRQSDTCFVSCRPIQQPTWMTIIGFTLASGSYLPYTSSGNWNLQYTASSTGTGTMVLVRNGSTVASWSVPNYTASTRMALVFNGRRVFAMLDGIVYGGDTSAYDQAPGTWYFPTVWDYYNTGDVTPPLDIIDIRYGAWSDVRVFLDDGRTVLSQSGFRTIEGTSAGITGQGPGATAPGSDVLNYMDAVGGGNGIGIIRSPVGGQYSYEGGFPGALRIDLPQPYTNTMIRFAVDIFNYSTGTQQTYIISGYTYQPSASWINVSAQYIGAETQSKRVRFGSNAGVCCIWIGETTDVWQYPKIVVRDVMVGYGANSVAAWKSGWGLLISATAPGSVNNEILKPRAGDAVLGESIFESSGGATATLANFKTALGVAASILGQGALATRNNVDLSTTQVLPRGSIPSSLANNGFTYTSTVSTITINWPSMTVYRSDGSTISIGSGSQAITGLGSGTTYRIYPYVEDSGGSSGSIAFVTAVGTVFGTPQILYSNSSPNVAAAASMYFYSRIPMGNFAVATTVSGGGGGGGGGWNCLHEDTLLGNMSAGDLCSGMDMIQTPDGYAMVEKVEHHRCSRWIELWSEGEMIAKVTERHLFYRAIDGKEVPAADLVLGDILKAEGNHVQITGLQLCTKAATAVGISIADPHLHFAGPRQLLCHNGTAKP